MEVPAELARYGAFTPVVEGDQIVVLHGAGGEDDEPVAIKLIQLAEGEGVRRIRPESFRNHAAALGAVSHPSLPGFVRSGIDATDVAFLVTRWVDGAPLGLPPRIETKALVAALADLLEALEALRRHGQGHLNIRPENLIRRRDGALTLVGLASVHLLDNVAGPYSAPELQVAKAAGGGALWVADLYSFALTFCTLLGAEILGAGTRTPWVQFPASVRESLRGVEGLRLVLEAALNQQPARRPASFSIVRRALLETMRVGAGSARPSSEGQWVSAGEPEGAGVQKPKTSGRALVFRAAPGAEDVTPPALVVPRTLQVSARAAASEAAAPTGTEAPSETAATVRIETDSKTVEVSKPSTRDAPVAPPAGAVERPERRASPRVAMMVPQEVPAPRRPPIPTRPALSEGHFVASPAPPMRLPYLRLHPQKAARRLSYRSTLLAALALSALVVAGLLFAPSLRRAADRVAGRSAASARSNEAPGLDGARRSTNADIATPDGPRSAAAPTVGDRLAPPLVELDREPPTVRLAVSQPDPDRLRLVVDADSEVATIEVWARQGLGEPYRPLAVESVGDGVYDARLLAGLRQIWARVVDRSGREAFLGSPVSPLEP